MHIKSVYFSNHPPYKEFCTYLVYPTGHAQAGQALDKVAIIGNLGLNKSVLLKHIVQLPPEEVTYIKIDMGVASKGEKLLDWLGQTLSSAVFLGRIASTWVKCWAGRQKKRRMSNTTAMLEYGKQ
jgi:hypothetical protein